MLGSIGHKDYSPFGNIGISEFWFLIVFNIRIYDAINPTH